MTEVINWIFTQVAGPLWTIIKGNVFLSFSVILGLIAAVVNIYKSTSK